MRRGLRVMVWLVLLALPFAAAAQEEVLVDPRERREQRSEQEVDQAHEPRGGVQERLGPARRDDGFRDAPEHGDEEAGDGVSAKAANEEEIVDYSNYTPSEKKAVEESDEQQEPLVDEDKLYGEK